LADSDRAQFQQVLLDAHQRRFDVVLCWSLDRFRSEGVPETLDHLQKLADRVQFLDSIDVFKDTIIGFSAALPRLFG
jgi:DNA invertase Pin-like site-specific DNA recombinase